MKVFIRSNPSGQYGIFAEPEDYDGVPSTGALLYDRMPELKNPERQAVASFLAFGSWTGGQFELPSKCGPNTAEAIEAVSSPVPVRPRPIEYYPKPLPAGNRTYWVGEDIAGLADSRRFIVSLPSDRYTGWLSSHNSLAVCSNAFLFGAVGSFDRAKAVLAVAVLFAEDLAADDLRLVGYRLTRGEGEYLKRLLDSVRLGFEVE